MFLGWQCQGENNIISTFSVPESFSTDHASNRSLGDAVAHTAGVISDPEFTEHDLNPETDKFLVVATDGLWEFINNKETVDITEGQQAPTEAVDVLIKESSLRWMREEQVIDDTTIIVANLFGYKSA